MYHLQTLLHAKEEGEKLSWILTAHLISVELCQTYFKFAVNESSPILLGVGFTPLHVT